jgi:hypothetical protein
MTYKILILKNAEDDLEWFVPGNYKCRISANKNASFSA